jgi:hypothetical protein
MKMRLDVNEIRRRDELPPLERAVSDTLDEYLHRLHGTVTSWADPCLFMEWLEGRGYKIIKATAPENKLKSSDIDKEVVEDESRIS